MRCAKYYLNLVSNWKYRLTDYLSGGLFCHSTISIPVLWLPDLPSKSHLDLLASGSPCTSQKPFEPLRLELLAVWPCFCGTFAKLLSMSPNCIQGQDERNRWCRIRRSNTVSAALVDRHIDKGRRILEHEITKSLLLIKLTTQWFYFVKLRIKWIYACKTSRPYQLTLMFTRDLHNMKTRLNWEKLLLL